MTKQKADQYTERINVRFKKEELKQVKKAAKKVDMLTSAFIRNVTLEKIDENI